MDPIRLPKLPPSTIIQQSSTSENSSAPSAPEKKEIQPGIAAAKDSFENKSYGAAANAGGLGLDALLSQNQPFQGLKAVQDEMEEANEQTADMLSHATELKAYLHEMLHELSETNEQKADLHEMMQVNSELETKGTEDLSSAARDRIQDASQQKANLKK